LPINLATSVFGMNVQEINKSGYGVGAVAITALVMLTITAVTWLLVEAIVQANATWRVLRRVAHIVNQKFNSTGNLDKRLVFAMTAAETKRVFG